MKLAFGTPHFTSLWKRGCRSIDIKGLPDLQPFPCDASKGLYLLNGFHNLHCLVSQPQRQYTQMQDTGLPNTHKTRRASINRSAMEPWTNTDVPASPYNSVPLGALRLEISCQADDIPCWNSNNDKPESPVEQHRQCRDWRKLEGWAQDHHACYR